MLASFALVAAKTGSAKRDTRLMQRNIIEAEFGTVVPQVLTYSFAIVPPPQRTLGQTRAFASASGWIDSILNVPFQPGADAKEAVHEKTSDSCDAVQIHYRVDDPNGAVQLRFIQTVYLVVVLARPDNPLEEFTKQPEAAVTAVAKRLFNSSDRLNFRVLKKQQGLVIGEQIMTPEVARKGTDWLDTIRWWSDGQAFGFAMMKNTGPGQAFKTSWDLEPNQVWFQMYERPRTR